MFEGEARTEKCDLLVKIFQKVPQNAFLACIFSAEHIIWPKQGFLMLWESLE